MREIFLVAVRDYRQLTATRGFWILLLVVPLMFAGTASISRLVAPETKIAYAIIDESGQYKQAIERRIELNYQRQVLQAFARYAERWQQKPVSGQASWTSNQQYASDSEIEAFVASGGLWSAVRQLRPHIAAGAPAFRAPQRQYSLTSLPDAERTRAPDQIAAIVESQLGRDVRTADGTRSLALVTDIPAEFGAKPARIWISGSSGGRLIDTIRLVLTRALRAKTLVAMKIPPELAARTQAIEAPLLFNESHDRDSSDVFIHSAATFAAVYLLLMASMITGSMMLQGVIEERSNRLLEAILSCIRPSQFMYGKLLGLGAVGLSILAVWVGGGLFIASMIPGVMADYVRPSLVGIDQPWMIVAIAFYFLSGYLIVGMCFLAVGSISNSMQDAQAYLMPMLMVIMLPVVLMMSVTIADPDTVIARVMSWIPLYTPFAMLARLGTGVSILEVLGTGGLLVLFLALQLFLLGRIFHANILNTGQRPRLVALARLMFKGTS